MKFKEFLNEEKGYYQLEVPELIKAAGGKEKLKKICKNADDAYSLLVKTMDKLSKKYLKQYKEVGEADLTELMDWCDNNFYRD